MKFLVILVGMLVLAGCSSNTTCQSGLSDPVDNVGTLQGETYLKYQSVVDCLCGLPDVESCDLPPSSTLPHQGGVVYNVVDAGPVVSKVDLCNLKIMTQEYINQCNAMGRDITACTDAINTCESN